MWQKAEGKGGRGAGGQGGKAALSRRAAPGGAPGARGGEQFPQPGTPRLRGTGVTSAKIVFSFPRTAKYY